MTCRDALAHVVLASQLSTQAGPLGESRPKVLLCQAEVARLFGLQPLTTASCGLLLDIYSKDLIAEDRALALCQLAAVASERSVAAAQVLLRGVARTLPHAGHLWAHIVGPRLVSTLVRAGESAAASALLFQAAGAVRAAPHSSARSAAQQLCMAANTVRLHHGQLLPAHKSAREAAEKDAGATAPGDVCSHLLCLTDAHLAARDPIGALGPCLGCLSAAESSRLLHCRAEALVRLARVKLEMRDFAGALQLAEEVTPQLNASGSARLRGEALTVQAEVLLALSARESARKRDGGAKTRLLTEAVTVLEGAAAEFEAVADLGPLRHCRYLLARTCHELGRSDDRNRNATLFREACTTNSRRRTRPGQCIFGEELPQGRIDIQSVIGSQGSADALLLERATAAAAVDLKPTAKNGPSTPTPGNGTGGSAQTTASCEGWRPAAAGSPARPDGTAAAPAAQAAQAAPAAQAGECPALAQLLLLAEAQDDGALGGMPVLDSILGTPKSNGRQTVPLAVGDVHALYPLAALLGA